MHRLNKTESAVFLNFRFSLFLKDPIFPDCFGLLIPQRYIVKIYVKPKIRDAQVPGEIQGWVPYIWFCVYLLVYCSILHPL